MAAPNKKWKSKRALWLSRFGFLVLSFFLWSLLQLGQNKFRTTVEVPILLIDTPHDRMILDPPKTVSVVSKSGGLYALREMWKSQDQIELSFKAFERGGTTDLYLSPEAFSEATTDDVPGHVEWTLSDTLWIHTSTLQRKALPVVARLDLQFEHPYYKHGAPEVNPDTIFLFGPPEVLDTMSVFKTPVFAMTGVEEDVNITWEIVAPEGVLSPVEELEIVQKVAPYTEKWVDVELNKVGSRLSWKPIPNKVSVKCRVPLDEYSRLQGSMIRAEVERILSGDAEVPVKFVHHPDFAEIVDWAPRYVEIIEVE
ncbi:YbbR-like domain-containing protein [Phaeocystidibacter luteus]|uniref:YbbR-like domain-containing protein n=1 Tax=Phaeocystidibacter luteus TaxID=911197 RepID=A0A6N6RM06_9FLAO|nr:hypothetical protein [Phaeocystidibacter luteus]KAB2814599.1 hypothetical protein F8C67_02330 [Phaeocystidibacter luteus]